MIVSSMRGFKRNIATESGPPFKRNAAAAASVLLYPNQCQPPMARRWELERVKLEHEFYCKRVEELEEHNRALTEAATKYSLWGQKLFRELATLDPDGAPRRDFGTDSWM
jgi:hypothetical protein